jgi:hypothetical protein
MTMLLTTSTGIVVNMAQVITMSLQRIKPEPTAITDEEKRNGYQVLLTTVTGGFVVAARSQLRERVEFLRKDIAHHWAEGSRLYEVATGREHFRNDAYYAQEARVSTTDDPASAEHDPKQASGFIRRGEAETEKGT